jgi:hypothetical protein
MKSDSLIQGLWQLYQLLPPVVSANCGPLVASWLLLH